MAASSGPTWDQLSRCRAFPSSSGRSSLTSSATSRGVCETVAFTQAVEGGIDSSHASFLHSDGGYWGGYGPNNIGARVQNEGNLMTVDTSPRFFIEPTEYGLLIGARRNTPDEKYYWRITQFVMPWYSFIPGGGGGGPISGHTWVPIDDTTTWTWSMTYHPDRPLTKTERENCERGHGIHVRHIPRDRASCTERQQ